MEKGGDGDAPVSKQDLEKFMEELKQFEVDTEFVWSLWKETQREPNAAAILARERRKYSSHIRELTKTLREKEKEVALLRGATASEESETKKVLRDRVTQLELQLCEKDSIIEDCSRKLQDFSDHEAALSERNREIELLKMEVSCEVERCAGLKERLMACETELRGVKYNCAAGKQEMAKLKDELEDVVVSREEKIDHASMQTANMKVLLKQNQKFRKEITLLKEKLKIKTKVTRSCSNDGVTPKEWSRRRGQIQDLESLLQAKSDELTNLRSVHDRRLERMKSLKAGYELALDQIKTYESKGSDSSHLKSGSPCLRLDSSPMLHGHVGLQQEDSEGVWNELAHYRSSCEDLKQHMLVLEEERDYLMEQCFRAQTELARLKSSESMKDDIEGKLSAIAAAEAFSCQKNDGTDQVRELEGMVRRLKMEKAELEKWSCSSECTTSAGAVEQKHRHSNLHGVQSMDRFTMTDNSQLQKLLKDAASMTDSSQASVVLVHSAVQACTKSKDMGCQSDVPATNQWTELVPSKSSYYSIGNFSGLKYSRSYSDSECTLKPEKSCEDLSKYILAPESISTAMLTPVASCGNTLAPESSSTAMLTPVASCGNTLAPESSSTAMLTPVASCGNTLAPESSSTAMLTPVASCGNTLAPESSSTAMLTPVASCGNTLAPESSSTAMLTPVASCGNTLAPESSSTAMLTPVASCGNTLAPESSSTAMLTPVASCETVTEEMESTYNTSVKISEESIPRSETTIIETSLGNASDKQRRNAEPSAPGLKLDLEPASSSVGTVKKHWKTAAHKCMWQQQVRTLQQRLRTVRRQVTVLNTAKQMLTHQIDDECLQRHKSEAEHRDLLKKHQSVKQNMEALKIEKIKLTEEARDLQVSVTLLKNSHHTAADWKKTESQLKELQNKCSSLNSSSKFMQSTLETKSSDLADSINRCSKLERDVKQKRALIEEYRRKQVVLKELLSAKDADIKEMADSVKGLNEAIEQEKQKVKSVQLQLSKARSERQSLENRSKYASEEIRQLSIQHEKDVKLKKALNQKLVTLELDLESQEREHQMRVDSLQIEVKRLQTAVKEFETFTAEVADVLVNAFKEEQLKQRSKCFRHHPETDALAGRVREIARSALNMSEFEVDEFFDSTASTYQVLSEADIEEHEAFKDIVQSKLLMKLKKSFARDLLKVFGEYVGKNIKDMRQY